MEQFRDVLNCTTGIWHFWSCTSGLGEYGGKDEGAWGKQLGRYWTWLSLERLIESRGHREEREWRAECLCQALPLLHPIPSRVLPVMLAMLHLLGGVWGVFCQELWLRRVGGSSGTQINWLSDAWDGILPWILLEIEWGVKLLPWCDTDHLIVTAGEGKRELRWFLWWRRIISVLHGF